MRSNDTPITQAEEEQFYGVPVTEHDINCAVRDQLQALDADDCAEVASEFADRILRAFHSDDGLIVDKAMTIGVLMIAQLKKLAQRRANRVLGLKEQA